MRLCLPGLFSHGPPIDEAAPNISRFQPLINILSQKLYFVAFILPSQRDSFSVAVFCYLAILRLANSGLCTSRISLIFNR
jgi:hypothetical protein